MTRNIFIIIILLMCVNLKAQIIERIICPNPNNKECNDNNTLKNDNDTFVADYHIYYLDYLDDYSKDGENIRIKNNITDTTFYLKFKYQVYCGGKDYLIVDDKLKIVVTKKGKLYYIMHFDQNNILICEGYSSTVFPIKWEGKMTEYYKNGNVESETILKNNKTLSEKYYTSDGVPIDTTYIIYDVDNGPNFINSSKGFEDSLGIYISDNLKYPKNASELGLMGHLYVSFIITKTGKVDCVKVLRGLHPILDYECCKLFKNLPLLKPGYINNKAVNIRYNESIHFRCEY